MSEWLMRGHFRYLRFKTFPMTPKTPQCKVFWALLLSSEHSGVPEGSKPLTFPSVGLHPHTWPKWGCDKGSPGVKAKALQGCGPRKNSRVTSQTPGSVRKCEGVNPHTSKAIPTWEIESRWTLETLENDCRGQTSMSCDVLYIIGKALEA